MDPSLDLYCLASKCSFCFEEFKDEDKEIKIGKKIHAKFNELIQCKLISKTYSSKICLECYNKLTTAYDFKLQLVANQKLLEITLGIKPETSIDSCYNNFKELLTKCSFCFEEFQNDTEGIKLGKKIHAKFNELIQCKLISKSFSSKICLGCYNKLTKAYDFKLQLVANQKLLEITLGIELEASNISNLNDSKEFLTEFIKKEKDEEVPNFTPEKSSNKQICPYCAKYYAPGALDTHIKRVHTEDYKYFCDHCPLKFKTRKNICGHMEIHMSPESRRRFQCEYCERSYSKNNGLRHHIQMTHIKDGDTFDCACGKSFKTKVRLNYHKRLTHSNRNEKFGCQVCNRIYPRIQSIKKHIRTYHKDKAPFGDYEHLIIVGNSLNMQITEQKNEKKTVKKERMRFKCDFCTETFLRYSLLKEHNDNFHPEENTAKFCCNFCGKELSCKNALNRHVYRKHYEQNKVDCVVPGCTYASGQKDCMVKHIRKTHKYLDDELKKEFVDRVREMIKECQNY
ncbi:hypothetical protein PVAND_015287 [Polypedilum vanderplanki]|uniref:C2H2-type domain-containing protein n=1 Tax=Polypedilum vanderplanki TaxID=319348 RepID=A0A9J6BC65_POLVA|nr:hypothetical protein PVAND_015287 [Polypedilum vanderplanki]